MTKKTYYSHTENSVSRFEDDGVVYFPQAKHVSTGLRGAVRSLIERKKSSLFNRKKCKQLVVKRPLLDSVYAYNHKKLVLNEIRFWKTMYPYHAKELHYEQIDENEQDYRLVLPNVGITLGQYIKENLYNKEKIKEIYSKILAEILRAHETGLTHGDLTGAPDETVTDQYGYNIRCLRDKLMPGDNVNILINDNHQVTLIDASEESINLNKNNEDEFYTQAKSDLFELIIIIRYLDYKKSMSFAKGFKNSVENFITTSKTSFKGSAKAEYESFKKAIQTISDNYFKPSANLNNVNTQQPLGNNSHFTSNSQELNSIDNETKKQLNSNAPYTKYFITILILLSASGFIVAVYGCIKSKGLDFKLKDSIGSICQIAGFATMIIGLLILLAINHETNANDTAIDQAAPRFI